MKERPILFNGPMVRAILEGRKTQTRRVVKPYEPRVGSTALPTDVSYLPDFTCYRTTCPYGRPGDQLWVREAHAIVPRTAYAASDGVQQVLRPDDEHDAAVFREGWIRSPPGRWRPSIHMPRWASRITLEITGVRVERLQDISSADALAEGVNVHPDHHDKPASSIYGPVQAFRDLWESINGPGSWDANPWVWVIEFKRIKP